MIEGARVDLAAGLWACAAVLLLVLVLTTALRPILRHRREDTDVCGTPGSLGAHPLTETDEDTGVQWCACRYRTRIPAGARVQIGDTLVEVDPGHAGTPVDVGYDRTDTSQLPLHPALTAPEVVVTNHPEALRRVDGAR